MHKDKHTSMELLDDQESATELLQAQTHVWNHTFSFINSISLTCAVELGIPDIIHSHTQQPMTLSALAAALHIHPNKSQPLYRLMRMLAHSGFFALQKAEGDHGEEEGYLLTASSRLLLKDHPFSLRPFVLLLNDPSLTSPYRHFSTWLRNDELTPFNTAHGESFWEFLEHEPGISKGLKETVATDSVVVGGLVTRKCREVFEGLESLVDVGGATGNMGKAIAEAFPHINCTVLDLPYAVDGLQGGKNLKYLAGDMFESIPPADAILFKWVLHDWSDEHCVKLLKKSKEAIMGNGRGKGKVIIIDMVIGNQHWDNKSVETQLFYDMALLSILTGRERNESEWAKLFVDAGFSHYKIKPVLGLRALLEVYP